MNPQHAPIAPLYPATTLAGVAVQVTPLAVPQGIENCIDTVAMAMLLDDLGPDDVAELTDLFVKDTTARLLRLASDELAAEVALREIHSLKGAASAVCAVGLSRAAAGLETRLTSGESLATTDLTDLCALFETYKAAVKPAITGDR